MTNIIQQSTHSSQLTSKMKFMDKVKPQLSTFKNTKIIIVGMEGIIKLFCFIMLQQCFANYFHFQHTQQGTLFFISAHQLKLIKITEPTTIFSVSHIACHFIIVIDLI